MYIHTHIFMFIHEQSRMYFLFSYSLDILPLSYLLLSSSQEELVFPIGFTSTSPFQIVSYSPAYSCLLEPRLPLLLNALQKMNKGENKFILDNISMLTSTSIGVSPFIWKEVHQFCVCDRGSPLILLLCSLISYLYFVEAYCFLYYAVYLLLTFYLTSS